MRDLAKLHVLSLTDPNFAKHGRYFAASQSLWFSEIIELLKNNRREIGLNKRIKTRVLGKLTLMVGGMVNPQIKLIYPFLNKPILLKMNQKLITALEE